MFNLNGKLGQRLGIPEEEMHALEAQAREQGVSLPRLLVTSRRVSEADLLDFWAAELGLEVAGDLEAAGLDADLVTRLPLAYLKKHKILPLWRDNGTLTAATSDPLAAWVADDLKNVYEAGRVRLVLARAEAIVAAANGVYGESGSGGEAADEFLADMGENLDEGLFSELSGMSGEDLLDESNTAPIIKLVNHILARAVKAGASDIHIEPFASELKVRFRLDGVLYDMLSLPWRLHAAVVSRIKIMSRLNIAEKRLPQDGRMEVKLGNRRVDLRVSVLPTGFGERAVLRLLEKSARLLKLEELGMSPDQLTATKRLLRLSHGIILVTGPTGSGKTTTLYSALSRINSTDKNILTIEDPVEYQIDGIGQMQVAPKIGLTFASGLRSIVRQDPDVILIGEIRDKETAEIAIQAALTGHLVFSTLHTNDAASAVTRLIDMGVEPFLISSSVRAIIAQRLVRVLCQACHEPEPLDRERLAELKLAGAENPTRAYAPVGCQECLNIGFRGRTSLFEFMNVSPAVQNLVMESADAGRIKAQAVSEGMSTLQAQGLAKVEQGVTTIEEVLKETLI
jgi:general secretion pathway protein E